MNRLQKFAVHLFAVAFLLCPYSLRWSLLFAQNSASLDVIVFDQRDAAVPDATVTLQALSPAGDARPAVTRDDGHYYFDVPAGRYRLTITHDFLRRIDRDLTLDAGPRRELRIAMQLEPLAQSVLVSAEALAIETTAASSPSTIITREEINRRQATQIAPLLASMPGFSLARTGRVGGVASLFLNGGDSNYTKVLIDGVTVNEPGGVADFSNYTLDNVEKVEVVYGAQSALLGSDAMTGVVQMLTHRGTTNTPKLSLLGEGGSFSTGRGAAQLSGLAGRLDYSTAAGYFSTEGQGPNNRFLNRTLSGNFGVRLGEESSLRLTLRNNTSDAGVAGQTLMTPPDLNQHNALQNFSAGLTLQFSTGTHWQHQLRVTETYLRQIFDNPLSDFFTVPDPFGNCFPRSANAVASTFCDFPFFSANKINRAGGNAQSSYVVPRGSLTGGYAYEVENGWLGGPHFRRNNQAGFIEGRWQPAPRLTVNAGIRIEDNASFGTRGVPKVGAAFRLREGGDFWGAARLRFAFGLGIKEPSLIESFSTNPFFPGNPNLLPERNRAFSAGVEQKFMSNRLVLAADYFDNRFRDVISFDFVNNTFFNTDLSRARGLNLTVDARTRRWLWLAGSYTYNDSRVLQSPNTFDPAAIAGNRLLRRPVHSGNLTVSGAFARVDWNLRGYFSGQRTDSSFTAPGVTSNPGYARFDLAGSYELRARMSVFGRIENLTNKQYQEAIGYPTLGRAAYVGMRFTLGSIE